MQRTIDRLQVQHDLRRLAWEKDYGEATARLESLAGLLKEFLSLPLESQLPQLDMFRDAAMDEVARAEAFLQREE